MQIGQFGMVSVKLVSACIVLNLKIGLIGCRRLILALDVQ
jgi:hypothetical protein